MKKIKLLIVDDSALIRKVLTEIFATVTDIEVVGTAMDPIIARDKIKQLQPDVITLDVEMPRMDGITFLRNLMRLRPMPVVMISTLTAKGAPATLEALDIGAVDFLAKPTSDASSTLTDYSEDIVEKVRAAAGANIRPLESFVKKDDKKCRETKFKYRNNSIIAIGASTGGTEAISEVLMQIPANSPPIVIAQHIPAEFSTSFATRLDKNCVISVNEARHNEILENGKAYLAPGDEHLEIIKIGGKYKARLTSSDLVNRHRPSVEVLFQSLCKIAPTDTVAVLLTGMGADGSQALLELQNAGAHTIAQDEKTSVVWGMPGVAVSLGAADLVLPLQKIAFKILSLCGESKKSNRGVA